jgi:SAF domain
VSNPALTMQRSTAPPRATSASLRPRRRPWLLVAGLLSMVVSAGAFAVVYLGTDAREQVLVVARPVAAGQVLSVADLRVVRIVPDPGVDVIAAAEASRAIGHTAAVPLAAGSMLASAQVGPVAWPPAGQVVVAVPVKAARLADGISAGVRVLVVQVAADTTKAGQPAAGQPPVAGTVVAVTRTADGSGITVVSLLLPAADAESVAGSSGDVSLALARG